MNDIQQLIEIAQRRLSQASSQHLVREADLAARLLLPGEQFTLLHMEAGDDATAELIAARVERVADDQIIWRQPSVDRLIGDRVIWQQPPEECREGDHFVWRQPPVEDHLLALLTCPVPWRLRALRASIDDLDLTPKRATVLHILGGARAIELNPGGVAEQLLRVLSHSTFEAEAEDRWSDPNQVVAVSRRPSVSREPLVELRYHPLVGRVPTPEEHERLSRAFPLPQALAWELLNRR